MKFKIPKPEDFIKYLKVVRRYARLLNPVPPIGGLEITDTGLRFLLIQEGNFLLASLRLPPGIVVGGAIRDAKNFAVALRELHLQIAPIQKPVHAILLLPASLVYLQSFSIPFLTGSRLEEAVKLNMQMLSPIDPGKAYFGWHELRGTGGENQMDFLGAFVEASEVDAYTAALTHANFVTAAIEFPALALVRAVGRFRKEALGDEDRLLAYVSPEGVAFMIVRHGALYFNQFNSWSSIQEEAGGERLASGEIKAFLEKEIARVFNFYAGRVGGSLAGVVLLTGHFSGEMKEIISRAYPSVRIEEFSLETEAGLDPVWLPALGAALRGVVPRALDTFLSLTPSSVQKRYFEERISAFVRLWQKVVLSAAAFVFLLFLIADSFLARMAFRLSKETTRLPPAADVTQLEGLRGEVKHFNELVGAALSLKEKRVDWAAFLESIRGLAGSSVEIVRVTASENGEVAMGGSAVSEIAAVNFRKKLLADPNLENVVMPLTKLTVNLNGSVGFSVTFRVKALPRSS